MDCLGLRCNLQIERVLQLFLYILVEFDYQGNTKFGLDEDEEEDEETDYDDADDIPVTKG